jgi:hypothetical protein
MISVFIISLLLTVFSTSVMAYISMATPIGPWIAPTLVLITSLLYRLFPYRSGSASNLIAYSTIAGSVGGIVATACGFSFPTLYFLNQELFLQWLASPWYFVGLVATLCFTAGSLGWFLADLWDNQLIVKSEMPFPIGQMIYKMIDVQESVRKSLQLMYGFISTIIFCQLQKGILGFARLLPQTYHVCSTTALGYVSMPSIVLRLDQFPMLWAIGFITGHVIAIPLAVGVLAKIFLVEPINDAFFETITPGDFTMAFCSGMVLWGTLLSFISLVGSYKKLSGFLTRSREKFTFSNFASLRQIIVGGLTIIGSICFLTYFKFSMMAQLFLLIGTVICSYQIAIIAGKMGLAPLGRFATFVMVPSMLLFGLDAMQITIVATFVEICGGVTTDMLFGRKVGHLQSLQRTKVRYMQMFGLLVSACVVGIVILILSNHFGLGSQELCVQRAQARALLINFSAFDYYVLLLGALFSFGLKFISVNPVLVLGGLLMPINYSLILIMGGISTYFYRRPHDFEPFWSGVFAANSIWILIQALM